MNGGAILIENFDSSPNSLIKNSEFSNNNAA
jgi:hypothetical protein